MYTFAGKQKFLELEPDVIIRIDDMLAEIDQRITGANTEMQMRNKEELEPWLEKYRIWQEMQK
jgi:hypothetical protein